MTGPYATDEVVHRDAANGASAVNDTATLEYLKSTFTAHYNGKRQPLGLYTHPIHVSVSVAYVSVLFISLSTLCPLSSRSPDRRLRSPRSA